MKNFAKLLFVFGLSSLYDVSGGLQKRSFSTKTTYAASFTPYELEIRDRSLNFEQNSCEPVFVDALLRHGIRNPGKKDINRINHIHERFLTEIKEAPFLEKLIKWTNPFTVQSEKLITETGRQEHVDIGGRFGARLNKLLDQLDVAADVEFVSSNTNRSIASCYAFQRGLAKAGYEIEKPINCIIENKYLRFFDVCKQYLEVKESGAMKKEFDIFRSSPLFGNMITVFKQRNRIPKHVEIKPGHMKAMYVVGASEYAALGSSVWLELFTDEEVTMMEYLSDLRSYWKRSYGFPVNYEMSCIMLKDMFDRIDQLIHQQPHSRSAIFRFAHAETLLPYLTLLGLYKDENTLLGTNFELHQNRLFRTSKISPFSANIAFVLLDCSMGEDNQKQNNDDDNNNEKSKDTFNDGHSNYKVQILHNELPIRLPFCDSDVCPLDVLRHHLKKNIEQCDFDGLCALKHDEL